ncbi:FRG domain-containing protein [Curtobacterium flaccumfaciens pv. flaccumfaciens]|uniref:FRG domain-containing protein n=1 Tax=Curtobacterium TaxID=2034 RepID=UPI000DAA47D8|nr:MULTISPECIES: FRG domain-containing protein [Curtobacterium]MCS6568087.1 FRG domain-containing protein [Curtobacterium flaccumfaciens pv. flaccumfaciens]MCS6584189.1 FRG domain-containing protein [Curtobacterium flaccumfaciens pv. flaccumfaciens]WIE68424.1 FRG domain-containing protein [Curtobacterium sp. MCLR17_054]
MLTNGGTAAANTTAEQSAIREDYWRSVAANQRLGINSAGALWDWLVSDDFEKLANWDLTAGENLFFRGQSDISYGLSSSLYRQLRAAKPNGKITELDLRAAEQAVVAAMRAEGLGRRMTDFELITVLQHHLMPTRLIDVSRSPLESLYFAVENNHGTDGVLFMINPKGTEELRFDGPELPWSHFKAGEKNSDAAWTNTVTVAEHGSLDPRMRAQNGTFLVGGLFRSYGGMAMYNSAGNIDSSVRTDVTTLAIQFMKRRESSYGVEWGAGGWVVRVEAAWKRELVGRLRDLPEPISEDTIYPAFAETARLAKHVIATTVSTP